MSGRQGRGGRSGRAIGLQVTPGKGSLFSRVIASLEAGAIKTQGIEQQSRLRGCRFATGVLIHDASSRREWSVSGWRAGKRGKKDEQGNENA